MVQKKTDLLLSLGEINFLQGHWDEALKCNRLVEQLAMKLKDTMLIGKAYRMIAYVERQRGNWDISYKYYTDALAIAQKLNDVFGMSSSLRGLGYLHWRRGEFDDAIRHYEESLKISKEINDKYNMGRTYIELGNVLNERGILAGAEFHYNTAIEILEDIGDQFELSRAYNNLGDIYLKKEEWENALVQFEKTIQYTIKIGDMHMRSWAYFNAAECYSKMSKTVEAEKYLEESKKLLWNSDDQVGIAYLFAEYGILSRFKKDYARSDENFKKAIKMVEDLNIPPVAAYMYIEYGQMLGDMGKSEEAVKWIEKALGIFLKLNANIYADRVQKLLKRFKKE
jgi:tetratricopeptide (TPR) repeat protein